MMRKLISWLSFMMAFCLLLLSCVHDEMYTASDPASKEYHSKSVFKEDEKYIKNVMQIYFEHEAEIKKGNAVPLWDYAMTMGNFDESFLIVPLAEGGKVAACLQVPRNGDHVRFLEDHDLEHIKFFQRYITSKERKAVKSEPYSSAESKGMAECKISAVSMWYPADEYGSNAGHWETNYIVTCPPESTDGDGNGGGEQPTYPYPGGGGSTSPQNPKNPCEKLKKQTTNATFKDNIVTLESKTGDNHESGYRINKNPDGSLQNQLLENKPGTQEVNLKAFSNTITLMHSHYDGLYPIFSPGDILLFNQWIVWAQNWNSVATNNPKIPLNDLTFTLVTSNGNYSFNFDGTDVTALPNYTAEEFKNLNVKYGSMLSDAVSVGNVSGNVSYDMEKLEAGFLKFMSDKMNMTGLKLYKTTTSGNSELSLKNGNRKETDCPN
ncbi:MULTISPECIES: hypothetical protein [Chryseobacterium]|uniref:Lipoprotein n=1 Tax=Chryseobacterium camelliae TaxID=1265445 RepID=A0ABU0TNL2_9FLAO|nr:MULTISPECIES: hypothetical protein [Chryseobacterium]MDT3407763.1 hypothetical protein [Pseudacidovorax intermedius]MDQ1098386.1 hypothetical protein [Chryseobacterium camelliae]MDQ1102309.1 hypothetical protein [Chryseobacterium sp. SORGH_AS_1048]MDR6085746.1 hypothetical protein [Chryseobacterium sp. SORGH_AS_0909]MDR6130111.1 hypothetical protein [Chryseobacterium sp. SORGH_AS_1175]